MSKTSTPRSIGRSKPARRSCARSTTSSTVTGWASSTTRSATGGAWRPTSRTSHPTRWPGAPRTWRKGRADAHRAARGPRPATSDHGLMTGGQRHRYVAGVPVTDHVLDRWRQLPPLFLDAALAAVVGGGPIVFLVVAN